MLFERSRLLAERVICAFVFGLLCLSGPAFAGTEWWTSIGPGGANVFALAIDPVSPNVVYAGASGGVFKTLDGAARWQPASNGLPAAPVFALAIDPKSTFTVYAGIRGHGLYKSTDGGSNWSAAATGLNATKVFALVVDPSVPSTLYAGTDSGVFKSIDAAASWTAASSGLGAQPVVSLAIDPTSSTTLYAGTKKAGVFRSVDGAGSWQAATSGLPQGPIFSLAVDPKSPSNLYAGTAQGVFKSTNGAAGWTATSVGFGVNYALAVDPARPTTVYAGQAPLDIVEITDGGNNWSPADTGLPRGFCLVENCYVDALVIDPNTAGTLYAGTQDGVFKSTDGGGSWTAADKGLAAFKVFGLAVDPAATSTVYAGTEIGAFRSSDGGATWTKLSGGVAEIRVFAFAILAGPPRAVLAATDGGIWKSVDGGTTWTQVVLNQGTYALAADPTSPNVVYAGGADGVGWSTDGGSTWNPFGDSPTPLPAVNVLVVNPMSPTTVYAGTDAGAYETIKKPDGRLKWVTNNALVSRRVFALALDPHSSSTIYTGTDGGLFKSTDGGLSWTAAQNGLTATSVFALTFSGSTLYAATNAGVFVSVDSGVSWTAMNEGLTSRVVNALAIATGSAPVFYAGTNGHSVFRLGAALSCAADSETLCLNGGRFLVRVGWHAGNLGTSGAGQATALTSDTGYFWFFQNTNVELVIKVLDGRALNQHFWVFYGALSNVEYRITVRDTVTGEFRIYHNPQNTMASVADTAAFPVSGTGIQSATVSMDGAGMEEALYRERRGPDGLRAGFADRVESANAGCVASATALCLSGGRFRVEVAWAARHLGTSGVGQAVSLTPDTGYFWFFQSTNVELIIKVLDARSFSGKFWVFYGALSNVEYTITVTDTQTGAVKTYFNPQDHLASNADTAAF